MGGGEIAAEPAPRPRVCVIGNSYVGALYRAFEDPALTAGFDFRFFASPMEQFVDVRFENGEIVGTRVDNGGPRALSDHDIFVIYAQAPGPRALIEGERELNDGRYSRQVREAALARWLRAFPGPRLMTALSQIVAKPIYMLSGNPRVEAEGGGSWALQARGEQLMNALIAPCCYIPFPRELFDEHLRLRTRFYRAPLNIRGQTANLKATPNFYLNHLNQEGGAAVLGAIVARLRADLGTS